MFNVYLVPGTCNVTCLQADFDWSNDESTAPPSSLLAFLITCSVESSLIPSIRFSVSLSWPCPYIKHRATCYIIS